MTTKLAINGWRPGLRKTSLVKLLRHEGGMTLRDAKGAVDDLISSDATPIEVCVASARLAHWEQEPSQIGAVFRIVSAPQVSD